MKMGTTYRNGYRNGNNNGNGTSQSWRSVVATAAVGLQLLSAVVWWALTGQLTLLQHGIEELSGRMNSQFSRVEEVRRVDDKIGAEAKRIDDKVTAITTHLTRIGDQTLAMDKDARTTYITRDQYAARHDALIEDVRRTQDRLNELRNDFSKIYTPTDTIKELQERIKSLESKAYINRPDIPRQ